MKIKVRVRDNPDLFVPERKRSLQWGPFICLILFILLVVGMVSLITFFVYEAMKVV